MKLPEPRKLPSGSWNIRVQIDGVTHSITKPTAKACTKEAMALKSGHKEVRKKNNQTVAGAINDYITARENVLSPSTIRGYRAIARTRFQTAMRWDIGTATQDQWQRAINQEAKKCSAKTLKNAWGFLSAVIQEATGRKMNVRLPQIVPNELPFLTAEQIPVFLAAIKGKGCEIAALLALSSLRRSEILALHWEDIDLDNRKLTVSKQIQWKQLPRSTEEKQRNNGSKYAKAGFWYFSAPKCDSNRTIDMDSQLTELLLRERNRQERAGAYFVERYRRYYVDSSKRITENPKDKEVDFVCRRENGEYINLRTMQYTTQIINEKLHLEEFDFLSLRHTHVIMIVE